MSNSRNDGFVVGICVFALFSSAYSLRDVLFETNEENLFYYRTEWSYR